MTGEGHTLPSHQERNDARIRQANRAHRHGPCRNGRCPPRPRRRTSPASPRRTQARPAAQIRPSPYGHRHRSARHIRHHQPLSDPQRRALASGHGRISLHPLPLRLLGRGTAQDEGGGRHHRRQLHLVESCRTFARSHRLERRPRHSSLRHPVPEPWPALLPAPRPLGPCRGALWRYPRLDRRGHAPAQQRPGLYGRGRTLLAQPPRSGARAVLEGWRADPRHADRK